MTSAPEQTPASRRGRWWPAVLAAAAVVALAVAAALWSFGHGHGDGGGGARPGAPAVNTWWRVQHIETPGGAYDLAVATPAFVGFFPGGEIRGNDGVNSIDAKYTPTSDGFRVTGAASTAIGYAGHDPRTLAVIEAVDAVFSAPGRDSADVRASVDGTRLTLQTGRYTLVLHRERAAPTR